MGADPAVSDLQNELTRLIEDRIARASARLNQVARRLLLSQTRAEWLSALLDGAAPASRAMIFSRSASLLHLEAARPPVDPFEIHLGQAPALAEAVRTGEPVVAARSPSELSEVLFAALGPPDAARAVIVPIGGNGLLYAEGDKLDANELELICSYAGLAWQIRSPASSPVLVNIQPPASSVDQDLQTRAQRFARVQVAEMRLYKSEAVKLGRNAGALYHELREEIDHAREQYRAQFLNSGDGLADYLHGELVRTLANDNEALLGDDYPGPLS